jgi:CrcB protein
VLKLAALIVGGSAGTLLRYGISSAIGRISTSVFPYGTLAVNLAGCLLFGMLAGMNSSQPLSENQRLLLITGFLGGFTTFSAYSAESLQLFQSGHSVSALVYVAVSNIGGILFAGLGYALLKNH